MFRNPATRPTPRDDPVRAEATGSLAKGAGLAARGARRRYRKGTLLIQEGDRGGALFVVLSGRVKVFSVDEQGREFTFIVLGPGEYFGEMSLDGGARSASVITLEACECAVLDHADVRACMAEDPDFAYDLLMTVIRRAREATRVARGLALGGVYSRLVAFLETNARLNQNGERVIEEVLTQSEIASRIGSGREMVSRIMKDLSDGGYVETRARRIVIAKPLPERW